MERELILTQGKADPSVRGEIMQIVDIFRARVVDIGKVL